MPAELAMLPSILFDGREAMVTPGSTGTPLPVVGNLLLSGLPDGNLSGGAPCHQH
jgi:hypothetical protein